MVKDVITVEPSDSVRTAAELMKKNEIGCLIVVEDEKPVGIVTERDMLNRVLMLDKDLEEIKVHDVMTESLVSEKTRYGNYTSSKAHVQTWNQEASGCLQRSPHRFGYVD